MATILRAPVYSSLTRRPTQPADSWPNLLLSTLALISSATPIQPAQIDQPRARPVAAQVDQFPMPLALALPPAQLLPIGENGQRELAQPRVAGRSQDANGPNTLLRDLPPAQQLPIGANGPDWTQPRSARGSQSDATPNLLTSTLVPSQASLPFLPLPDWPQPRLILRAQDLTGPQRLAFVLAPVPLPFLAVPDWSQPRATRVNQSDAPPASNLLLSAAPAGVFSDWSQPSGVRRTQADAAPNLLTSTLAQQQQALPPGAILDSRQWRKPVAPQDTSTQNVLLRDLAPLPLPFLAQYDLTLPRLVGRPQDWNGPNVLLLGLPASSVVPGAVTFRVAAPDHVVSVHAESHTLLVNVPDRHLTLSID